jgi:hypothetical protein
MTETEASNCDITKDVRIEVLINYDGKTDRETVQGRKFW